jgi:hypothetical protein
MILKKILVLMGLSMLISFASCAQIDEITGPFKVSFELPVDMATTKVDAPNYADNNNSTQYGVLARADNWSVAIVITKFIGDREIDLDANRRSVAASAGLDASQAVNHLIDGKNAVYSVKETDTGTMLAANYWLDANGGYGATKTDIIIWASVPADKAVAVLDTLKISYDAPAPTTAKPPSTTSPSTPTPCEGLDC